MSNELEISRECDDGICVVKLSGTLDMSLSDRELVTQDATSVVFDFSGIRRVTSFGILMWSRALEGLSAMQYMAISRCRPCIVQQLNVITGFAGPCEVVSIYLPYVCDPCDKEFDVLWDLHEKHAAAKRRDVSNERCPKCGKPAEFDDIADSYFTFTDRIEAPHAPSAVAARLLSMRMNDTSRGSARLADGIRDKASGLSRPVDAHAVRTAVSGRGQGG